LFAALNVATGAVQSKTTATEKRPDVQTFLARKTFSGVGFASTAQLTQGIEAFVATYNLSPFPSSCIFAAARPTFKWRWMLSVT
jgi:hypothetical protein